jgi:paraquat-inducible protein B
MNRPTAIGLFVLGALAIAVVLALLFGSGRYFTTTPNYVSYFQGSVHGLNVGAPVKLKGVLIGRVTDIRVLYDRDHDRVLTPVIAQVDLGKIAEIGGGREGARPMNLSELIARGLRARLNQNNLVSGQLYMDLSFLPDKPVVLVGGQDIDLPEIPTVASGRDQLESTLEKAMADFRELPLKDTVEATLHTVQRLESLLAAPETRASIVNLNQTLVDLQGLIRHVDAKVDRLAGSLTGTAEESHKLVQGLNQRVGPLLETTQRTLGTADRTLHAAADAFDRAQGTLVTIDATVARARGTLETLESFAEPDSELNNALNELSDAARAIRAMAEALERHPDAVLYGRREQEKR